MPRSARRRSGRRRDLGRVVAIALCTVFALIGAAPLTLGLLVRTSAVRAWAAREASSVLVRELGVNARFELVLQAWPLLVRLDHVVVDATTPGEPFLEVEQIAMRPRPLSLLAGKLDAGDLEIVGPRIHAVVEGGKLLNFQPTLPAAPDARAPGNSQGPFSSLAVTDARVDLILDGAVVRVREIDADLTAEQDGAYEVALRTGVGTITRVRPLLGRDDEDAVDEDVVCRFDARARIEQGSVLVRRLTLQGALDADPDPGTRPTCALAADDWRAFEVGLGAVRIDLRDGAPSTARGRLHARLPAAIAHRFVKLAPVSGFVALDVEVDYDAKSAHLPRVTGHLSATSPGMDSILFAEQVDGAFSVNQDVISSPELRVRWADGDITISDVNLSPFVKGSPLSTGPIEIRGVQFTGLLRDLGVHPQSHVRWTLETGHLPSFKGTLDPLALQGPIAVRTRDFDVFDRPASAPERRRMMGVHEAHVRGTFMVQPKAIVLSGFSVDTPRSHVETTVSLGYESILGFEVRRGSRIDLSDVSPLGKLSLAGMAELEASAHGPFDHPKITGELAVRGFKLAGLPVGDVEAHAAFEPLVLTLSDARVQHGKSRIRSSKVRIAFDDGADVLVDADVDTRQAPHLAVADFFNVFQLDQDPRFEGFAGVASGAATVHYALGGREDRCGDGYLEVRTRMNLADVTLFGERYDDGYADLAFIWDDSAAGSDGMRVDLRAAALRKDAGTVLASGSIQRGGGMHLSLLGSALPIARLDMFGLGGRMLDGHVSFAATVGGTLAAPSAAAAIDVSRVRIGPSSLPPSKLTLAIEPSAPAPRSAARTRCGNLRSSPFDRAEYERDLSNGTLRVDGALFDGQVVLDGLRITQQRHKVLSGKVATVRLDVGTLSNLIPGVAFAESAFSGQLTSSIDVARLPFDDLARTDLTASLRELVVQRDGRVVELIEPSGAIVLRGDELTIPDLKVRARSRSKLSARLTAGGVVRRATSAPELALGLRIEPMDLSRLSGDVAEISRITGTLEGDLRVDGPLRKPRFSGGLHLAKGELSLRGWPIAMRDAFVDVAIGDGEVRVTRAIANVGTGTVSAIARMPVRGLELGQATAEITARGVMLPVADGVQLTADADLDASFLAGASADGEAALPDVKGTVSLLSFNYTRPIAMSLDLSQLTGKSQRTKVTTYDPADDVLRFHINVIAPKPLRFSNNLIDLRLEIADRGVMLSGTNQRFGAQGILRIAPDSKLRLRANEFEIREGYVRFDDPARINPIVEVRAQTEYRRYAEAATAESATATSAGGGSTSGQWKIDLHAHGEPENLKIALTSDPPLSQEDILLMLTMGMTRAEMDSGLASSLGQTVGLEALSQLTGADQALKTVVPIIDEFRFGTGYSSRTGRTEPNVTLGKKLTDNVRANVTTGLTENREVRSTIEWKIGRRTSVQGSYDNVNDVSSSVLGNLGADLRWRLEFE
jgi:translocation and assembly module TamB